MNSEEEFFDAETGEEATWSESYLLGVAFPSIAVALCLVRAGVRWFLWGQFQRCPGVWWEEGDWRQQHAGKWSVGAQVRHYTEVWYACVLPHDHIWTVTGLRVSHQLGSIKDLCSHIFMLLDVRHFFCRVLGVTDSGACQDSLQL